MRVVFKTFTMQTQCVEPFELRSAIVLPHWPTSQEAGSIGSILDRNVNCHKRILLNVLQLPVLELLFPLLSHQALPFRSTWPAVGNRKPGSLTQMLPRISVLCGLEVGSAGPPHEKAAAKVLQPHYTGNSEQPCVTLCTMSH